MDCNSSDAVIQPIPYPFTIMSVKPTSFQFRDKVFVWVYAKDLMEVKVSVALHLSTNSVTPW